MVNARVTAYGAVVAAGLALLSPSGSACDNRYSQSCGPKPSPAVETNQAAKVAKGAPSRKLRAVKRKLRAVKRTATRTAASARRKSASRARQAAKWRSARQAERRRTARAVVQQRRKPVAAGSSQPVRGESVIVRRFRGFITPISMSTNVFEVMRKPRLDGSHLVPAATVTVTEAAMVAPSMDGTSAAAPAGAEPETTGSADFQLAAADSVIVSEPPLAAPAAQIAETAKPAERPSDSMPLRELFLALCGALTAASALRFVVGA